MYVNVQRSTDFGIVNKNDIQRAALLQDKLNEKIQIESQQVVAAADSVSNSIPEQPPPAKKMKLSIFNVEKYKTVTNEQTQETSRAKAEKEVQKYINTPFPDNDNTIQVPHITYLLKNFFKLIV